MDSGYETGIELNGARMNPAGNGNATGGGQVRRRQDSPYPSVSDHIGQEGSRRDSSSISSAISTGANRAVIFQNEFRAPTNPNFFIFQNPGQYSINFNAEYYTRGQGGQVNGSRAHQGQATAPRPVGMTLPFEHAGLMAAEMRRAAEAERAKEKRGDSPVADFNKTL